MTTPEINDFNNSEYSSNFEIDFSPRDYVSLVLPNIDIEFQLIAIRHLLRVHKKEDEKTDQEIKEIESYAKTKSGFLNVHATNEWVDRLHQSVYQSAAHSMSAVGMLAPFIESLFHQAFIGIQSEFFNNKKQEETHIRWNQAQKDKWNCHYIWTKNGRSENLVKGIMQLSEATGLIKFLPDGLERTLSVLFAYRNKMFHCGFEWPIEERKRFWSRIKNENWPSDWLSAATSDDEPWCIYLTESFIEHCVDSIDKIIDGIGLYADQGFKRRIGE